MATYYRIVDIVRRGTPCVFKPEHEQLFCGEDEVMVGLLRGPINPGDSRKDEWVVARDVTQQEDYDELKNEYSQGAWSKVIIYRVPKIVADTTFQDENPIKGGTILPVNSELDELIKKSMSSKKLPE